MVFVSPDFSVNSGSDKALGYGFALPRVVARLAGGKVRCASFSAAEAYGVGLLVFGLHCTFLAQTIVFPFVRQGGVMIGSLCLLLPIATWLAWLFLYYANSLLLRLLRRSGLFQHLPNYRFQSVLIVTLTTLIAFQLLGTETRSLQSLGGLWLVLLVLNLLASGVEKLSGES